MRAPKLPSVFKLTEHNRYKRFNYEPRTFDERKQRLEKRKKEIEKELAIEKKLGKKYEEHLRESINDSWTRRETRRVQRNSSLRVLLILAALLTIVYYLYF
ncbi:MAG: hypothetical protein AAGC47_05580 [Bacteroidota bacterium]